MSPVKKSITAFILAGIFFSAIAFYDTVDDKPLELIGFAIIGTAFIGFFGLHNLFIHMDRQDKF